MPRCSEGCCVPLVPLIGTMTHLCPYCSRTIHAVCTREDLHQRPLCTTCWDRYAFFNPSAPSVSIAPTTGTISTTTVRVAEDIDANRHLPGDVSEFASIPQTRNNNESSPSPEPNLEEQRTKKIPKKRKIVSVETKEASNKRRNKDQNSPGGTALITLEQLVKPFAAKRHVLVPPPPSKQSKWWCAYHLFDTSVDGYCSKNRAACCNLCGKSLELGSSLSTSPLLKHMKRCNLAAYEFLLAMKDEEGSNPRKVLLASPNPDNEENDVKTYKEKVFKSSYTNEITGEKISLEQVVKPFASKAHLLEKVKSPKMSSSYWLAFHCYDTSIPEAANKGSRACCNLCGNDVGIGPNKNTSNLAAHLKLCNPAAYKLVTWDTSKKTANILTLRDLSLPFSSKRSILVKTTSVSNNSKWWVAFHQFDPTIAASGPKQACCNLCGAEVSPGKATNGFHNLGDHLSERHRLAFDLLQTVKDLSTPAGGIDEGEAGITIMTLDDIAKPFEEKKELLVKASSTKTSVWWFGFHCYNQDHPEVKDKEFKVCCNHCGCDVNIGKSLSTSPMLKHLHQCSPLSFKIIESLDDVKTAANIDGDTKASPIAITPPRQDKAIPAAKKIVTSRRKYSSKEALDICSAAVSRFFVSNAIPIDHVGTESFRSMLQTFQALGSDSITNIPSGVIRSEVKNMYESINATLAKELRGREIVITVDTWDSNNEVFQMITASWIQDFAFLCTVLDVKPHAVAPSATQVKACLKEKFETLGIGNDISVTFCLTVSDLDMASIGSLTRNQEEHVIRLDCLDRVLQQIADIVYRAELFGGSVGIVEKARCLAKHVASSLHLVQHLIQAQTALGTSPLLLLEDELKRWWSTYEMLERLLHLRSALSTLHKSGNIGQGLWLLDRDWDILQQIVTILKPFMQAKTILAGRKYATASLVPFLLNAVMQDLTAIAKSGVPGLPEDLLPEVVACAEFMLEDLRERCFDLPRIFSAKAEEEKSGLHESIWLAHALDPRFKKLPLLKEKQRKDVVWNGLLRVMVRTVKSQKEAKRYQEEQYAETTTAAEIAGPEADKIDHLVPNNAENGNNTDKFFDALDDVNDEKLESIREGSDEAIEQACEDELHAYKFEQQMSFFRQEKGELEGEHSLKIENNPLDWWRENHAKYPFLWSLAQRLLAIPVTAAPMERAFQSSAYRLSVELCQRACQNFEADTSFVRENVTWLPDPQFER